MLMQLQATISIFQNKLTSENFKLIYYSEIPRRNKPA